MSADAYAPSSPSADRARDAALLVTLAPGAYTVTLRGVSNGTGVGLVDINDPDTQTLPKLVNISTRGFVGTNSNVMVGGFIIGAGTGSKQVLIRGMGPTLASFGVTGVLANPVIELYADTDNNPSTPAILVADNDDWGTRVGSVCYAPAICGSALDILNTGMSADAYAPSSPSADRARDAALLVTLAPGAYPVTLRGLNNVTGVGLIDVNEFGP
jgi:hypothetical protein